MMEMVGMKDGKMDEMRMMEMMDERERDMRRKEHDDGMNMEDMKELMETCNTRPCMKEAKEMCEDMKDEMDDTCDGCIKGFVEDDGCGAVALLFDGEITLEQLVEGAPEECLPCAEGAMWTCLQMWGDICGDSCGHCESPFLDAGGCDALENGFDSMGLPMECSGCNDCANLMCMLDFMEEEEKSPIEMAIMINSDKKGVHSPKFSHFKKS